MESLDVIYEFMTDDMGMVSLKRKVKIVSGYWRRGGGVKPALRGATDRIGFTTGLKIMFWSQGNDIQRSFRALELASFDSLESFDAWLK